MRITSTRTFMRIVWILIGVSMIGPATWFIADPILRRHQGFELPMFILAPVTLLNFLLYALGRVICVILAICLVITIALREIPVKTKLITGIVGILVCATLLYWVAIVQHSW